MELGAFSVSLSVADLEVSQSFYEKLGFEAVAGDGTTYRILANASTVIGLFQGVIDENILTFNPGLEQDTSRSESFTDVRDIERALVERGIVAKESTTASSPEGPAHILVVDPDGNPILIDQFF